MTNQKNTIEEIIADPELKEELKALVLARIQAMPDSLNMAVGSTDLSKIQIEQHVEKEDEIGTQIMEIELEFLRDLSSGAVYGNE